jgi:hypothetical protein
MNPSTRFFLILHTHTHTSTAPPAEEKSEKTVAPTLSMNQRMMMDTGDLEALGLATTTNEEEEEEKEQKRM